MPQGGDENQRSQANRQARAKALLRINKNQQSPLKKSATERGSGSVKSGADSVQKGAQSVKSVAQGIQKKAEKGEKVGKRIQTGSKALGAASSSLGAASQAAITGGEALAATEIFAPIGAGFMAAGAAGKTASTAGTAAAEAGEATGKLVEVGSQVAGESAKAVEKSADTVDKGAGYVKGAANSVEERSRQQRLDAARQRVKDKNFSPARFEPAKLNLQGATANPSLRAKSSQADPEGPQDNDTTNPGDGARDRASLAVEQAMAKRQQQAGEDAANDAPTKNQAVDSRDEIKQAAKAAFRRGLIYSVDLVAGALDLSSGGMAFVIDGFLYVFTLGWLNLEMIYGKWIARGKSQYVSPISYAPFPMPVDKDAFMLQGAIIMADIVIIVLFVFGTFFAGCFGQSYVYALVNGPIQVGLEIVNGTSEMCAAAIIGPLLQNL